MIAIDFLTGPDTSLRGYYKSNFNYFTVGHDQSNSIIIKDPDLQSQKFSLFIEKDLLFIKSHRPGCFFSVSGKKFSGKKQLKANDFVKIGDTTIKVISFKYTTLVGKSLQDRYRDSLYKKPELAPLLEKLELELVELEK